MVSNIVATVEATVGKSVEIMVGAGVSGSFSINRRSVIPSILEVDARRLPRNGTPSTKDTNEKNTNTCSAARLTLAWFIFCFEPSACAVVSFECEQCINVCVTFWMGI